MYLSGWCGISIVLNRVQMGVILYLMVRLKSVLTILNGILNGRSFKDLVLYNVQISPGPAITSHRYHVHNSRQINATNSDSAVC